MDSGDSNIMRFSSHLPTTAPPPALTAAAPRLSKKRSRPSRRTPTTVLATDTSNFRAMVQIFTGIPLPSSSPLQNPIDFSSPLLLDPFSPNPQSNPSFSPISSLCSSFQSPINAQQSASSDLFQYVPSLGSSEDLFVPEKFGFVSLGGSEEAEDGVRGKKRSGIAEYFLGL